MDDTTAEQQPDEIGALKEVMNKFMARYKNIENEIALLKEDQKELIEEFKPQLDIKTLKKAIQVIKIENDVKHKDTFDTMVEVLRTGADDV